MTRTIHTVLLSLVLLVASCGGSQTAGIEGSGAPVTAVGPITGFGSIFVNRVEYGTANAQIDVDGQPGTESQLAVGDVVTVVGTVGTNGTTGTASRVTFRWKVAGTVTQVDLPTRTFVALGQTVLVSASTVFDAAISPADISGIQSAVHVQVSGFANSFGQLVASRIEPLPAGDPLRVEGAVQALNTTAHTFQINSLLIDYSAVAPSATLMNGNIVDVEGSGLNAAGALVATAVEAASALAGATSSEGEVDGVITAFTSAADFRLSDLHVTTTAATQFSLDGVILGVNVRVAVVGSFDASGNLVATAVETQPEGEGLVRGLVQTPPSGGALTVLGVTIATDATTEFEDDSSAMLRPFHLSDLHVGDYVEARGRAGPGATLHAEVLLRETPDSLSFLQDTATSVSYPSFTLLGVSVITTAQTQYAAADGSVLSAARFFAQAANQTVEAGGTPSGASLIATQVQIQGQ